MSRAAFIAACLYYYGREFLKIILQTAGVLVAMFMIYKLMDWILWVLSF